MDQPRIVIEKGIPIPERIYPGARPKYPFAKLQVGESFFLPSKNFIELRRLYQRITAAASSHRRLYGGKFTIRQMNMHGVVGIRIWKIEKSDEEG
jgi:hypothetical protein